jgi:outer membrane lipoprotein-sorting protein
VPSNLDRDLQRIYCDCRQQLFTCALVITRSPHRAEDAVHDAFCRLFQQDKRPDDLLAYVFRAVHNAAIDQVRRYAMSNDPLPDFIFDPQDPPEHVAAWKNYVQNWRPSMDQFETRLKSLSLRTPSAAFGRPETLAALREISTYPSSSWGQKTHSKPWLISSLSILGLATAILLGFFVLTNPSGTSIAFAQVLEKITAAKTLAMDIVAQPQKEKSPPTKVHLMFLEPYKIRGDVQDAKSDDLLATLIADFDAGKSLLLSPKIHLGFEGAIKVGDRSELQGSMVDDFRSLAKHESKALGQKQIDGISTQGFEIDNDGIKIQVWANAKSGDPVRVEMRNMPLPPPLGKSTVVIQNFQIDPVLDPTLFSVAHPAGYLVLPSPIEIDMTAKPTEYVVTILKYYSQYNDGKFPDKLDDDWDAIFKKLPPDGVKIENQQVKMSDDVELRLARLSVTQLYSYFYGHKSGIDYQYFPGGTLSQKDRIVFWCRDRKTGEYSAVFGDLRIAKINKDQLPKDTENAGK